MFGPARKRLLAGDPHGRAFLTRGENLKTPLPSSWRYPTSFIKITSGRPLRARWRSSAASASSLTGHHGVSAFITWPALPSWCGG
jgi:hypothetical protein